ncbi:MAG: LamG domain-containing protein [Microscillaceae bacterium]|jgi:hypothetical protein|nr:LamG domain-containing protein [Microscillaceae bacterium]
MKKHLILLVFIVNYLFVNALCLGQSARLIAHYPMKDSPVNVVDDFKNLKVVNVVFKNQALYCAGEYGDFDNNQGKMISTPQIDALDLNEFSIAVDFMVEQNETMPVFVLGYACRLLSFGLDKTGNIHLEANNGEKLLETNLKYQPRQWHNACITYQKNTAKAHIYLDGELGGSLPLSFTNQCINDWLAINKDISTTNFANGKCFQGYWRNLKIYNGIQTPSQPTPSISPNNQPASIDWLNPNQPATTSKSGTYTLKACVKSESKINQIELFVNDVWIQDSPTQGIKILKTAACQTQIEQKIALKVGNNRIMLKVSNAAGSQTSEIFIQYDAPPLVVNDAPINQKITKTILNTQDAKPYGKKNAYEPYSVLICPDENNGAYIAWQDQNQQIRISQIDARNQTLQTLKLNDKQATLYAICADNNGFAILLVRKIIKDMPAIHLIKYNRQGTKLWDTKLIGDANFDQEGNRAFSDWSTPRLVYNGREYMAFFGISRKWDDGVVHQGDIGFIIDKTGKIDTRKDKYSQNQYLIVNGSAWGSSHSFEQRLMYDGLYFHTLAKGDAYPRGLAYGRILSKLDNQEPVKTIGKSTIFKASGQIGENYVPLALGGMVSTGVDGECVLSFVSNEGRSTYDIGFIKLDTEGTPSQKWLTNTPNLDENNCYMAKYGENYLIAWTALNTQSPDPAIELDDFKAMVVDKEGNVIIPIFDLNAQFQRRYIVHEFRWAEFQKSYNDFCYLTNDFINFSNGDIGWVRSTENQEIEIIRIGL